MNPPTSRDQERAAVRHALATLPRDERLALALVHYQGMGDATAAAAARTSQAELRATLHKALHRLRAAC